MQPSSQKYVQPFERESSFELQTKSIHKTGREAGQKGPPVHHSSFITNTSLFQSYRWPLLSSGWVGAEDERSTTCIHSLCSLWKHERGCSEEGRRNHWHLACELHSTTPAHVQTWLWLTTATSDFLLNIWTREDDTMRGGKRPTTHPLPLRPVPCTGWEDVPHSTKTCPWDVETHLWICGVGRTESCSSAGRRSTENHLHACFVLWVPLFKLSLVAEIRNKSFQSKESFLLILHQRWKGLSLGFV